MIVVQTVILNSSKIQIPYGRIQIFFIHLPFKKNEDVNPTKDSHRGMNPEHLVLAKQELSTILTEGLIEPTTFSLECEAFYLKKHAMQIQGKLKLVIDYQDLNHFLANDKFSLPNKSALFQHLSNAKVFSKFDLKARFWQLGIHSKERYKKTFCIRNHHYQWIVMPFSLKNAPSQFQKVMVTLFQPLLTNSLIYVDDFLLFSKYADSHKKLLTEFYNLVKSQGIMLSEKKLVMGVAASSLKERGVRLGRVDQAGEKMELPPRLGLGTINITSLHGRTSLTTRV